MMDCRDVEKEIHPYMDGEYELQEAIALESHLEDCASCRSILVFETHFLRGVREKLDISHAPDALKLQIMHSISVQENSVMRKWMQWLGLSSPEARLQFTGAFAFAMVLVTGIQWVPALLEEENLKNDAAVRQVTARVNTALPVSGMTPDLRNNAPNPVLALVSGAITTSAIGTHLNQNPKSYKENSGRVWESLGAQFRNIEPPLRETRERRLLGARVEGTGLVASVVYEYDVSGSRVTAIQSILPKGWGSQGRFYNVDRRDGLTVITYQQSEDVLTSLVSRAEEKVIRTLAQESIIP